MQDEARRVIPAQGQGIAGGGQHATVAPLPVGFREVIVMREIEDMSYKEISSVAGIPMGTVMSRLARGRELLKSSIETRVRRAS